WDSVGGEGLRPAPTQSRQGLQESWNKAPHPIPPQREGAPLNTRCAPPSADVVAGGGAREGEIKRDGMHKAIAGLLCITVWIVLIPAEAGHELPYYPSFYPHEIRVEVVSFEVAAARLQQGTLQAYIGATPHFSESPPAHVSPVSSLGAYLVVTFDGAAAQQW